MGIAFCCARGAALHRKPGNGVEQVAVNKIRLEDTPKHPSTATAMALAKLSFACARCGLEVLPISSLSRVTCRSTPLDTGKPLGRKGLQDSLWCDRVTNTLADPEHLPHLVRSTLNPLDPMQYFRYLSCTCGERIGFRHENSEGEVVSNPGEQHRSHKLIYWNEDRGFVLRLISAEAWSGALETLPPPSAPAATSPSYFEQSLGLVSMLHGRARGHTLDAVVDAVRELYDSGTDDVLIRSLRSDELPDIVGLLPKDGTGSSDSAEQVLHGNKVNTAIISTTRQLSIALLWAIPFGRVAIMNLSLLKRSGADICDPRKHALDLSSIEEAGRLGEFVLRSDEVLLRSPVPAGIALEIHLRLMTLVRPVFDSGQSHDNLDGFPAGANDFTTLVESRASGGIKLNTDFSAVPLARGEGLSASFVLIRMQRNAMPSNVDLDPALIAGRKQLRDTLQRYNAEHRGGPRVVYYEADYEIVLPARLTSQLDDRVARGVPFLLLKYDAGDPASAAAAEVAVRRIYEWKKGGTM